MKWKTPWCSVARICNRKFMYCHLYWVVAVVMIKCQQISTRANKMSFCRDWLVVYISRAIMVSSTLVSYHNSVADWCFVSWIRSTFIKCFLASVVGLRVSSFVSTSHALEEIILHELEPWNKDEYNLLPVISCVQWVGWFFCRSYFSCFWVSSVFDAYMGIRIKVPPGCNRFALVDYCWNVADYWRG
jgi:hypothetical protein